MQQDGDFGFHFSATPPSRSVNAQEVGLLGHGLDLVGVVEPARMQAAAHDLAELVLCQYPLHQGVGAKIGVEDRKYGEYPPLARPKGKASATRRARASSAQCDSDPPRIEP